MPYYLADSSIWGWADGGRRPDIAAKLGARIERDEIATCAPVVLEVLHRARTAADYDAHFDAVFSPLHWVTLAEAATERALAIQRELAGSEGNHRRPAVDLMIAAAAELAGDDVVLWFFDRDLRVICEHTGQPFEAEQPSSD